MDREANKRPETKKEIRSVLAFTGKGVVLSIVTGDRLFLIDTGKIRTIALCANVTHKADCMCSVQSSHTRLVGLGKTTANIAQ